MVDRTRLMELSGHLAAAARMLVGGHGLAGKVQAADVHALSQAAADLRHAVDDYDKAIVDFMVAEKEADEEQRRAVYPELFDAAPEVGDG